MLSVIGFLYCDDAPLDWLPADGGAFNEFLPVVLDNAVFDEKVQHALDAGIRVTLSAVVEVDMDGNSFRDSGRVLRVEQ